MLVTIWLTIVALFLRFEYAEPVFTLTALTRSVVRLGVFPGKHNPDDGVSGALLGVGIKAFNAGASIGVRGERKGLGVRADISGIGGRRLQAHIKGGLGRGNSLPGDRSPRGALNIGIRTPFFYVGAGLKTDKPDPRQ